MLLYFGKSQRGSQDKLLGARKRNAEPLLPRRTQSQVFEASILRICLVLLAKLMEKVNAKKIDFHYLQ
jgi:hypothetical protein